MSFVISAGRRRRRSGGGGVAPDYIVDDATSTTGYDATFTPAGGDSWTVAVTLNGTPVTIDYDTFTTTQLDSGDILTLRDPAWTSPDATVTPGLYLVPSPGISESELRFEASGAIISSGTYTVPDLTPYAGQEVIFYETVVSIESGEVTRTVTLQSVPVWTPYYTEFGSNARLSTAQPLGANTRSFLICVQGTMTEGTTNQQILWMSSDCRVSVDGSGFFRVLFSDPAGANDMTVIMNASGSALAIGDEFTTLFAYHNGAFGTAIKRNSSAFITQSNVATNVDRRMDQPLFIGSDSTPSQRWTGGFARIAFWTDVGSLVDVTNASVQNQFVAADGTPQGLYATRGLYGNAASGKLRLDLTEQGESFVNNGGAVTGITKVEGTLT